MKCRHWCVQWDIEYEKSFLYKPDVYAYHRYIADDTNLTFLNSPCNNTKRSSYFCLLQRSKCRVQQRSLSYSLMFEIFGLEA